MTISSAEPIVADVVISTEVAEEPTEEVVAVEEVGQRKKQRRQNRKLFNIGRKF